MALHEKLPDKLSELTDELDRTVREVETARALTRAGISPQLTTLAVRGLKHLLEADLEQARQVFEAIHDELHDRTMSL